MASPGPCMRSHAFSLAPAGRVVSCRTRPVRGLRRRPRSNRLPYRAQADGTAGVARRERSLGAGPPILGRSCRHGRRGWGEIGAEMAWTGKWHAQAEIYTPRQRRRERLSGSTLSPTRQDGRADICDGEGHASRVWAGTAAWWTRRQRLGCPAGTCTRPRPCWSDSQRMQFRCGWMADGGAQLQVPSIPGCSPWERGGGWEARWRLGTVEARDERKARG